MEESTSKKYGETRLSKLEIPVESIKEEFPAQQRPSTFKQGLIGFYDNDSYLIYNVSLLTEGRNASDCSQIFLMDRSDVEYYESPSGGNKKPKMLNNLTTFMFYKPDKKIYLRVFKPLYGGFEIDCVFKEEVLNILPYVSRQQGSPITAESFKSLYSKWAENTENARSTIGILPLSVSLSQYLDIDKSLITLVNDLTFTWSSHIFLDKGGKATVLLESQDGKCLQHPSHAALLDFQLLVCGKNWKQLPVQEKKMIKERCLRQMLEYHRLGKGFMIECPRSSMTTETSEFSKYGYFLPGLHHDDTIPIAHYLKMCKQYGLPNYKEQIIRTDGKIEVYLSRAFMTVGWMGNFLEDNRELDEIRDLLLDGLSSSIPSDKMMEFQYFLKNVVFPVGLYSSNGNFASELADPNKEENERIAKLAAANEKRKQKLQEKKNAKKKKPERAVSEKTELPEVAQNKKEKEDQEFQQLAEQLGLVYGANSVQYVKVEDLETARNSDDGKTTEEVVEAPSENKAKSKKKNNKKKKKRQAASEVVAEDASPAEELEEPHVDPVADPVPEPVEPEPVASVVAEPAHPPPASQNAHQEVEPVADPVPQPAEPIASRDPNQESSSCSKCLRTSKKCQAAIKAQNIAQSKADSFESKAKRTEEVEKRMREMEEEMRQMKLQLATHLKHSEENERLRQKISKREKIEEDLRREKKELILRNENLETEIGNLKKNMENEDVKNAQEKLKLEGMIALIESATKEVVNELTAKTYTQEDEITNLKDSMSQKQTELSQAMEINGKYHMENSLLKSKVRRLENDIEKLREHASQALEPVVMDRRKLLELRKLKDDFGRNTIMEEAQGKVTKIKTLPDTTENFAGIIEAAGNELIRLETLIYSYQDFLDLNVRIYQKSHDISKILDLPEYPKISETFSNLYSRMFPVRPPVTGIPDTDCPICYETRLPEEEVLDCDGCPYIFHAACLRKWFEDKKGCTVCPQCQQPLRDPDQYPALR